MKAEEINKIEKFKRIYNMHKTAHISVNNWDKKRTKEMNLFKLETIMKRITTCGQKQ